MHRSDRRLSFCITLLLASRAYPPRNGIRPTNKLIHALNSLIQVDSRTAEAPDWATVAVYTCASSCRTGQGEVTTAAKNPGEGLLVGGLVCIERLQGRADLNGCSGILLNWHEQSERWMVEVTCGDLTEQVRSLHTM